ncbi:MAG: TonB-dependent receptor [Alphaproteobacteria bacterium]|nr:TonB-dependent receptor [Alphaproteobacteria bacterium]
MKLLGILLSVFGFVLLSFSQTKKAKTHIKLIRNQVHAFHADSEYIQLFQLDTILLNTNYGSLYRLKEEEGVHIFSGKKTEVLNFKAIDANFASNNARQALAQIPGLTIWENDGSGVQLNIATRGLSPNRSWEINILQNGYSISPDIFGYPDNYYSPPFEAVDKIELIRGGAALQYGSQFGGVVNFQLKKITANKPINFETQTTLGGYGFFNSYINLNGTSKKWKYGLYNNYRSGNDWRQNNEFKATSFHGFVERRIAKNHIIGIEYTNAQNLLRQPGGLTDLQFFQNPEQSLRERNWFFTKWNILNFYYEAKFSKSITFESKMTYLNGERSNIGFLATPNYKDSINTKLGNYNYRTVNRDFYNTFNTDFRFLYSYNLGGNANSYLAFGGKYFSANTHRQQRGLGNQLADYSSSIVTSLYPTDLEFGTENIALYAENKFGVTPKFSITPGLRIEQIASNYEGRFDLDTLYAYTLNPETKNRNFILFGLGLEYKFKSTHVYANASQAYRPALYADFLPTTIYDEVDPSLKDSKGWNFDLGFNGNYFNNALHVDLSLFTILYQNRIGTLPKYLDNDPSNTTYLYKTNLGTTLHKGLELSFNINFNNFFSVPKDLNVILFSSYAYIDARYQDFPIYTASGTAPNSIISETNLKGNRVEYVPQYVLNLGVHFVHKIFTSTIQSKWSDGVYTDAKNTQIPNAAGTIGYLNNYNVIDFTTKVNLTQHLSIKGTVNNLTNKIYATRRSTGLPGPGIIPAPNRQYFITLSYLF